VRSVLAGEGLPVAGLVTLAAGSRGLGAGVLASSGYGQGVGAQGGYGPLLMASIDRVQADLLKPECAKDFKNVKNTINKAGKVDFKDMGTPKVDKDLNPTKDSPAAASYNSVTGAIRLNSQINWIDPDDTPALQGKKSVSLTLLRNEAGNVLGLKNSITAAQFMDIVIFHELAHYNGNIGDPNDEKVEQQLWNDCVKK